MNTYKIHVPLQHFEGAKSGRVYTCTRGAIFEAPEGDFKELGRDAYSKVDSTPADLPPGSGDASDDSEPTCTEDAPIDDSSSPDQ